jgi:ATP-dependent Clp protease ATP-binding subunit ClpA
MESTKPLPFTSRTRVAVAIARAIAAARGDRDLTPTHIAVGILREGANAAIAALWYAGLSERTIRALHLDLEHSLSEPPGRIPPRQVTVDATPGEDAVARLGEAEADRFGDSFVGVEHLLLAILRSNGSVAQRFAERGVSAEAYYNALLSVRRGDPLPGEPQAV